MKQYKELCEYVLANGEHKSDRTGTGTISVFGDCNFKHDLSQGFPLLTTKKMFWNGVVDELLWFISGSTNVNDLPERSRKLWSYWAGEDGRLGPIYGQQWRNWKVREEIDSGGYWEEAEFADQLADVIEQIKKNPDSRRLIVSAWNVADVRSMALPPCHTMFQFYVSNDLKLSLKLYQRSGDLFLGVPFNIASYALLVHLIANLTDLLPGTLHITYGDLHIYKNHVEQIKEQISREPKKLPELIIIPSIHSNKQMTIDDFTIDNIKLIEYNSYPAIKGEVSV